MCIVLPEHCQSALDSLAVVQLTALSELIDTSALFAEQSAALGTDARIIYSHGSCTYCANFLCQRHMDRVEQLSHSLVSENYPRPAPTRVL